MTFFRQIALLLPSAFLLGVLLFLLTHGRSDAGFGLLPFLEQWLGPEQAGRTTPEIRFLAQSAVFFLPAYVMALLLVLGVAAAERGAFASSGGADRERSGYRRSFAGAYSILFLAATGAVVLWVDAVAARKAPGAVLAPLIVALAPFAAGAAAVIPAAALAAPLAALRRTGES